MSTDDELSTFVRDALRQGLARTEIQQALARAGWDSDQIAGALSAYAEVDFPIPVPRPKSHVSARDAFLYLVLFATLYVTAYNLGQLLFQFVNLGFPDAADPEGFDVYARQSIRWAISSLIIAFPVFLFVSRVISRAVARDPSKRASGIRKWLTYMTLFVAAGVVIGDLIALVYSFLSGELTIRFVLKVLTIGVIAGSIFGYYLRDVRVGEEEQ